MKNNTTKVLLGLIILLTMTTLLGLRKQSYSVPLAPEAAQLTLGDNNMDLKKLFFDRYTSLIVSTDGKKIDPALPLLDTNLNIHKLISLTKNKSVLVFRYSFKDCDQCVGAILKTINKQFKGIDKSHIILITDSYSNKDFVLKARYTDARIPLYSAPEGGLGLPAENRNLPFFFILGNDHKVEKMFLPFKELPDQTEEYLTYCKQYLNNN